MAFDSSEKSAFSGRPDELYLFQVVNGGPAYRYTSMRLPVSYQSYEYVPKAIQRGDYTFKKDMVSGDTLKIEVQADLDLLEHFKIIVPRRSMRVTIYRRHRQDGDLDVVPVFIGRVRGVSWEGAKAVIECDSMNAMAKRGGLTTNFQVPCNHFVYGPGCALQPSDWRVLATVDSITDGLQVTAAAFAEKPDGWFKYGFLETSDGSYTIIGHTGSTVTLLNGLEGVAVGETVSAYAGCDLTLDTCWDRFSNGLNHLGFTWSPEDNVFVDGF